MIRLNLFMIWFFALSFLIISYLQVLSSKFIKSNHCCFSIYSFHAFLYILVRRFRQRRSQLTLFVNGIRMKILENNPYRLLGVYSNSPTKERLANHNRMKAFLKVGKSVSFPLDLPSYFGLINRTDASVADAEAKLTLPKDQILYAQFWFIKMTPLDEVAFNHLFAGEIDKAEEIWQKRECLSALQNRIVCALIRNRYDSAISVPKFCMGIHCI